MSQGIVAQGAVMAATLGAASKVSAHKLLSSPVAHWPSMALSCPTVGNMNRRQTILDCYWRLTPAMPLTKHCMSGSGWSR